MIAMAAIGFGAAASADAWAQTGPTAPKSAAAAPAPPSEHARQLAAEVLIATGSDPRGAEPSTDTMNAAVKVLSGLPGAKPEWRPQMEQAVRDEMKAFAGRLFQADVDFYATHFTEAQLGDMLGFYLSPTGRAVQAQTAALARERAATRRKNDATLLPHMVTAICAKVACPPPPPAASASTAAKPTR